MISRERVVGLAAVVALLGGLGMAAVAAADRSPARLPPVAGLRPAATSSTAPPTGATSGSTAVPSLAPLPTAPDVPDADVVHDAGPNDASIPVPASGEQAPAGDRPVELRIPSIGVRTRLVDLGIAKDGTMQVPADFSRAGWLTAAPAPGQRGPAVIAGHVDSHREGPVPDRPGLRAGPRPGAAAHHVQWGDRPGERALRRQHGGLRLLRPGAPPVDGCSDPARCDIFLPRPQSAVRSGPNHH